MDTGRSVWLWPWWTRGAVCGGGPGGHGAQYVAMALVTRRAVCGSGPGGHGAQCGGGR